MKQIRALREVVRSRPDQRAWVLARLHELLEEAEKPADRLATLKEITRLMGLEAQTDADEAKQRMDAYKLVVEVSQNICPECQNRVRALLEKEK